jgi:hypothetical protein
MLSPTDPRQDHYTLHRMQNMKWWRGSCGTKSKQMVWSGCDGHKLGFETNSAGMHEFRVQPPDGGGESETEEGTER